tara:strand:- start:190 stop:846 length:657 start_codon:yes stop_codon:yes gene_type:complete
MIKMLNKYLFFLFLPIIFYGQEKDFQQWTSLEINFPKVYKTDISFASSLRLEDDAAKISKYFFDLNFKREIQKFYKYSIGWRYIYDKNKDLDIIFKNRYYIDFYLKKDISKRIKFNSRTRIQSQIFNNSQQEKIIKNKLRQKFKFTYINSAINLDPFISGEIFYLINGGFQKFRIQSGFQYPFGNKIDLEISFLIEKRWDKPINTLWYVNKLKISYKF